LRTVFDLMQKVSSKLAHKPVRVRFQHNEGFKGLCRTDSSGIVTIDLEPELQFYDTKEFLRVFLHEIAHAKNDNFKPIKLEVSDRIPVSRSTAYNQKETRADKQAETWLKYAEENRENNLEYFEGCLWSLLNSSF